MQYHRQGKRVTAIARILIVDDDPSAIEVLAQALEGQGELYFAVSGTDALAVMANDPADLILLDADMPDLDGFATCRILGQTYPEVPVIFVTAFGDEGHEIRALEAGAVDFIHKPIKPPIVRARVGVHIKLAALNVELHSLSNRDPLTGIANRRALDERLALEWRRAARCRQPLGLLMIDVDHFKRYNDRYGHIQGDDCLRRVARAVAETANRSGDLVARYGGEEFVVLVSGDSLESAVALGEKVCAAVRALAIPHDESDAAPIVTVSIGIAGEVPFPPAVQFSATDPPVDGAAAGLRPIESLISRADRALYTAKAAGRNRVCVDNPGRRVPG
ncbi:diguanylate cyclase [Thiocapsa roseopersicina]|uniref:diguanylate cyclase n=1 Tax=Thiocapsa roseopersicina TaxID=1058 RepID=A0A1H2T679_THIRO|nr:diguanylate cyclase [Thiocapsa roseopersicina]SDW39382.1 response regulator receiver modulated diguanylate cyclase [Thiocapsa roseopersicina]